MSLFRRKSARLAQVVMPRPMFIAGGPSYDQVDVSTMESSMQSIAVRTAVDLIASLVSELPIDVFTGRGEDRRRLRTPDYLEDPAGDGNGREDWLYQIMESWMLRGNIIGEVLEAGRGDYPTQIDLHHPDRVRGQMDDGKVIWTVDGHEITRPWHRRVHPVPGCVLGLSPIQAHAADIGLNVTLTRFGLQYFQEGGHPGAVLTNTEKQVGPDMSRDIKDRFLASVRGKREPAVLGRGWKYEPIRINPEESQFLETRGFSAAESARIFGPGIPEILGYQQAGSTLTYANLQSRSVHLLVYAVGKWLRRADRLLTAMLPRPHWVRLDRDALLETTTLDRYQAHSLALGGKPWKTANEVRVPEGLPSTDWGDQVEAPQPQLPGGQPDGQESE